MHDCSAVTNVSMMERWIYLLPLTTFLSRRSSVQTLHGQRPSRAVIKHVPFIAGCKRRWDGMEFNGTNLLEGQRNSLDSAHIIFHNHNSTVKADTTERAACSQENVKPAASAFLLQLACWTSMPAEHSSSAEETIARPVDPSTPSFGDCINSEG